MGSPQLTTKHLATVQSYDRPPPPKGILQPNFKVITLCPLNHMIAFWLLGNQITFMTIIMGSIIVVK